MGQAYQSTSQRYRMLSLLYLSSPCAPRHPFVTRRRTQMATVIFLQVSDESVGSVIEDTATESTPTPPTADGEAPPTRTSFARLFAEQLALSPPTTNRNLR